MSPTARRYPYHRLEGGGQPPNGTPHTSIAAPSGKAPSGVCANSRGVLRTPTGSINSYTRIVRVGESAKYSRLPSGPKHSPFETAWTLYRARCRASTDRLGHADQAELVVATVRLARCSGCGAPPDVDSLAPSGMEAILATELPARPTAYSTADSG